MKTITILFFSGTGNKKVAAEFLGKRVAEVLTREGGAQSQSP
jgi:hypothetical protein